MPEKAIRESKIRYLELDLPLRVEAGMRISDVILKMQSQKQGCVLVCHGNNCTGIFTERDYLNKIIGANVDPSTAVDNFMSKNPKTLALDSTVGQAIVLMHENGIRNVPLVDQEGKCAGLLRITDIIDFLAEIYPEEVLNIPPRSERFDSPDGA